MSAQWEGLNEQEDKRHPPELTIKFVLVSSNPITRRGCVVHTLLAEPGIWLI